MMTAPSPLTNHEAATQLEAYADLLELRGESSHRLVAYRRAATSVRASEQPLSQLAATGRLRSLPGVGTAIEAKLRELVERGSFHQYDELAEQIPPSLLGLLEVPQIGPKKALRLYQELGIADVTSLAAAARDGRLRALSGFSQRAEQQILAALDQLAQRERRRSLGEALPAAERWLERLRTSVPGIVRAELGGSLRRLAETVGDVDLVGAAADPAAAIAAFVTLPEVARVTARADDRVAIISQAGLPIELLVARPEHYGARLVLATGNAEHRQQLHARAAERGLRLTDQGLLAGERLVAGADEAAIYTQLGLAWIAPELRQGQGEIAAAASGRLPALVTLADLQGELHSHSTWSDGGASIETMALAARAQGWHYLAITDHSAGLAIAGGLDAARLRQQRAEIAAVQARVAGIRLLQGVELEIRADGSLDLDDATLAELDLVIASLHVSLRQPGPVITERLLRAIAHPLVDIIGHPTGRIIGRRAGAELELARIIAAASANGTVLEVSADPARLDLADAAIRAAVAAGVTVSIDTDAHHPDGFANARFGIGQARRGWATAADVLNTRPWPEIRARLKRRRVLS